MAEAKIAIEFRLLKFGSSVWFSVTAVGSFSWNENQCKLSDFPPFDIIRGQLSSDKCICY